MAIGFFRLGLGLTIGALSGMALSGCSTIRTRIEIDARREDVKVLLHDARNYPEWNPFVKSLKGDLKKGEKVVVVIKPPDSKEMTFKPKVLTLNDSALVWQGHFLIPGLFSGEHHFEIETVDSTKVVFHHFEHFSGIFVPFFSLKKTEMGFVRMNEALKRKSEMVSGRKMEKAAPGGPAEAAYE